MRIETLSHESAAGKCKKLAALIERHANGKANGAWSTAIAPLGFMQQIDSTAMHGVSEPILAIVVQGQKKVFINEETYRYSVAQCLIISVDLPLSGFALGASPDRPYLGLKLSLDPVQLSDIIAQMNPGSGQKDTSVRGWFIGDAEPSLIDCAIRLTQLLDTPQDIPFLALIILREIYYRLSIGEQGEAVRQIATSGSNRQHIAKAIERIKADFMKP